MFDKKYKFTSLGTSPLMTRGLMSGFEQLGYQISNFPCRSWMTINYNEGLKILEQDLRESHCDFLIFGGNYPNYFLEIPNLCKKYKCKYIYWAIEDPVCFNNTLEMCKKADYVFTTTYDCIRFYKQHGIEANLLLFACNPEYHKIGKYDSNYDYTSVLQASYYIWESRLKGFKSILEGAIEIDKNMSIWGAGWEGARGQAYLGVNKPLYKGYFPNDKLGDLCASTKFILGVQCDDTKSVTATQTAMRPYEVLSCGGFHLTQYTAGTNNTFQDFKHLVMSKSKSETIELIKYFLNHEDERNKIRFNGYQYVRKYHTYLRRVKLDILPLLER